MRILNILVSILFLTLLGVGLYFIYNYFYGTEKDIVVVPDLIGMDVNMAKNSLSMIGLELQVISYTFSDKPQDVVVKQYPSSGSQVSKGAVVKVILSSGKKIENVPNLENKNFSDSLPIINSFINKYNLTLKVIYYPTLWFDDGKILIQYPNDTIPKDRNINFLVAKRIDPNSLLSKNYSTIDDFLYNVNVDSIFFKISKTDTSNDRFINNFEFDNGTIIATASLNYSQLPEMKITNIHLKTTYTNNINLLEVFLSDYLGKRLILKQYYIGVFSTTLEVTYFAEGEITVKINNKKVSSYSLP